ncbi:hypothetical protein E7Y31_16175, partial [Candidatus Frankia alpina]
MSEPINDSLAVGAGKPGKFRKSRPTTASGTVDDDGRSGGPRSTPRALPYHSHSDSEASVGNGGTRPLLIDVSRSAPDVTVHHLVGREYRQRDTHLAAVNRDGDEYAIAPGRLDVSRVTELRDVAPDLSPGPIIETMFNVAYTPPGAEIRSAIVTDRDMRSRDPVWPQETGIGGVVPKRGTDGVSDAIRAAGMTVRYGAGVSAAYGVPGLLLRPGRPAVFLRQGAPALTATGVDPTAMCELPPQVLAEEGIRVLGLDDPSTDDQYPDDMAALLRFLDVCPDDPTIALAMLAQLVYAPWAGLPGVPRLAVAVAGDTGIRKSAMAGIITGAQSRLWTPVDGDADRATVNVRHGASSKIGMDRLLYHLAGMVGVVDDAFAGNLSPADERTQWAMLSGLAQSMATQKGGTKATRDGVGIRTDRYPRCSLLVTAEDFPNEDQHGSEIARYLALQANSEVDTTVLTEVQQSIRAISRAHARMIQDGLADLTAAPRAIAWAREQVADWERNGHNRARANATLAVAGARLLADHVGRALGGSTDTWADMWTDLLHGATDAQARRCGMTKTGQTARNPVNLFVRRFREMLRDGTWYLASPTRGPDGAALPPVIPGYGPGVAGWRQGAVLGEREGTQWFPAGRGDPLGAVRVWGGVGRAPWRRVMLVIRSCEWDHLADTIRRRVRDRDGWSIPAAGDLLHMLADEGWAKSSTPEKSALRDGDTRPSVYKLDLGRMLDIPENDSQDNDNRDGLGNGGRSGGGDGGGTTNLVSAFDPRCLACGEMTGTREPGDGAYWWNGVGPLHASCDIPEQVVPEQVVPEQVVP